MSAGAQLRRGWCPSLQRPMPSGDGLLVRLGLQGEILTYDQARGIADCARRFGNGLIDLTQRGNLQLRGVSSETLPALAQRLVALGLAAESAPEPAGRDVIASPLAGVDPQAICDIRPLVETMRRGLIEDASLAALPDKFCWLIDDGGRIDLGEVAADIRFEARMDGGSPCFAVALGGTSAEATPLGFCTPQRLPDLAAILARAFLKLGAEMSERPRRMRDLLAHMGSDELRRRAGPDSSSLAAPPPRISAYAERPRAANLAPLGFHRLDAASGFLGIGLPFGRCPAEALDSLADAAERHGGDLCPSLGRCLLVTGLDALRAARFEADILSLSLVTRPDDPRLAVVACPGSPACANASVATRADALALAPLAARLAQGRVSLHISGCAKGCARTGATEVTLTGREGRYDLVLDGSAGDAPVEAGLSLDAARAALARLASTKTAPAEARPRLDGRMG